MSKENLDKITKDVLNNQQGVGIVSIQKVLAKNYPYIRELQGRLGILPHGEGGTPGLKVDGDFGGNTHTAVILFQTKHKLYVTGDPDEDTMKKLRELTPGYGGKSTTNPVGSITPLTPKAAPKSAPTSSSVDAIKAALNALMQKTVKFKNTPFVFEASASRKAVERLGGLDNAAQAVYGSQGSDYWDPLVAQNEAAKAGTPESVSPAFYTAVYQTAKALGKAAKKTPNTMKAQGSRIDSILDIVKKGSAQSNRIDQLELILKKKLAVS